MQLSIVDRWRRELAAQGYTPDSVRVMGVPVSSLLEHSEVEPHELSRDHVLEWLGDHTWSAGTRIKYLQHVGAFARWVGIPDPTIDVRRPRRPIGLPRPVAETDLERMLEVARPGRERSWVILGAFAGLRSHESAKVEGRHLTISPSGWHLLEVLGKGGQLAIIPASPIVVDVLEEARALAGQGRLWPTAGAQTVQDVIRAVARRAGVTCSSHQLRHRYGTVTHASRGDLLVTQQAMRHSSPASTAVYALVAPSLLAQVVNGLPGAQGAASEVGGAGRPRLRLVT